MSRISVALTTWCFLLAQGCADPSVEVAGSTPVLRDIETTLTTNGRIEASSSAAVHVSTPGRVKRLLVARGDAVTRGQELLRLADTGQESSRSQAHARFEAARARLALLDEGLEPSRRAVLRAERDKLAAAHKSTAREVERLGRLVSRDAVPRSELELQQRSLNDLEVEIGALDVQLAAPGPAAKRNAFKAAKMEAEAALRKAEQDLGQRTVRAPRAGTLYSLAVAEGDYL